MCASSLANTAGVGGGSYIKRGEVGERFLTVARFKRAVAPVKLELSCERKALGPRESKEEQLVWD